jgi:acyl-CoA synthetase (AMP-forming)/AMP-acid ligase II
VNTIDYFDRGWMLGPDVPCMIDAVTGETHTYRRVRDMTLRIAARLRENGHGPGTKAAVLSPNDPLGYTAVLGILRSGVTWLPLNARGAAADTAGLLAAFDCDLLIYHPSFAEHLPVITEQAPAIKEFVPLEGVEEWLAGVAPQAYELPPDPDRVYAIQATGGTTGLPKGVLMSDRGLENIVACFLASAPCPERPVYAAAAPLTHAAGQVMQYVMSQGGTALVFPGVDPDALLDAIPAHGVTHMFLPPTAIYALLDRPGARERDYGSLRYFFYGASPMAAERLAEALDVFGPVMGQIYGQTEAGVPVTFLSPADHFAADGSVASPERLASCGRPTPFCRVEVMRPDGALLGPGEIGEIVVRGAGVTPGYYRNPEAGAEITLDGWHRTGDVGYHDDEGYFYIVDRMKDMIITGGFNVYSAEVERALLAHPDVRECAVLGIPDPKWGEAVTAVVELKSGREADAAGLIAFCRERLGPVKTPKTVDFVAELPRTPAGKLLKRTLRERYWADEKRRVH